ncbi:MAG: AIR synthase-related protein, partial [Thermoactinomyces sp.]
AGDAILLLGETFAELGGSELQHALTGQVRGRAPVCDLKKEKALQKVVLTAIRNGFVSSAHDVSEGGLAVALTESCISGQKGAEVTIQTNLPPIVHLFSESQSRVLLSVPAEQVEEVLRLAETNGIACSRIGQVTDDPRLSIEVNGNQVIGSDIAELTKRWEEAIPCAMNPSSTLTN